ncbi:MAG: putative addiction module antidote protein [Comamonadaceae bacterium]|nr:putative addiction module antidote protein [Comamonadaceae bacterium]
MTHIADLQTFDVADYLDSEEKIAEYLTVVLEDNDPTLLAAALGDIARARGMTQLARDTGLTREALYRSLCATGNPSYATIVKVMQALGLKLVPQPLTG